MIDVAIFSFNRPDYLRNCVESVRRNMPQARLRVYDDASDDPDMLAYLDTLGDFLVRRPDVRGDRHGGLYANMTRALSGAQNEVILMLQDDMQVVRPVSDEDIEHILHVFSTYKRAAFIGPLFMKADRIRRFRRELVPEPRNRVYCSPQDRAKDRKTCLSYFDVHIGHVPRLRDHNWVYLAEGEGPIGDRARELFGPMPVMADPLAFFCPEVPFYRNRSKKTLASRLADQVVGGALKAYHDLTEGQVSALKARDLSIWPVAEDFLTPTDPRVRRPFVYKDVKARHWLYALHKIEQALRG